MRFDAEISSGGASLEVSHFSVDCKGNSRVDSDAFSTVINAQQRTLLRLDHHERLAQTSPVNDRMLQGLRRQSRFDPRFIGGSVERLAETQTLGGRRCWGWSAVYKDNPFELWASADGGICEMIARAPGGEITARLTRFRYHQDFSPQTFSL